jgi:hypothetical protein
MMPGMGSAVDNLRSAANLAVELGDAYVSLVIAESRLSDAIESGDANEIGTAVAEVRSLNSRIERIELERAVVRSVAVNALVSYSVAAA